ncbi:HAMP domain-containing histidine kinase [candidate division KSB1 bacterium]|nr:HAMP domain-containing histidine kinase [candidate division KSB1 bacterium]
MDSIKFLLVFCILAILACACSSPKSTLLQPDKQRYQFQNAQTLFGDEIILSDLDGDGFTEIISIDNPLNGGEVGSFVLLMTFEGKTIEQANFAGRILDTVYPVDYEGDGILEIMVPFVRNDSLFVSFINHRGEKLFYFFIIDGKPRIEEEGVLPWDPYIRGCYIRDLDQDGTKELITVIATGYARMPRGVLVHSLPDGNLIGDYMVGSPPRDNFLDDFDGDGKPELLCFGTAPNNGVNVGGFDDQNSYLMVFDFTPIPQKPRSKQISCKFSNYILFYEDLDGDGKKELLAWTEANSEKLLKSKIALLDPITFNELKRWPGNFPLLSVIVGNIDQEPRPEIVAIRSNNEVVVLDHNFEQKKQRTFPLNIFAVKSLDDIDKDGLDGIIVTSEEGEFLLDAGLKVKASFPGMRCVGTVHRGEKFLPQIMLRNKNHFELGHLVKNRFYLVTRYYSMVLAILITGIIVFLMIFSSRLCCRCQMLQSIQTLVIDDNRQGFLVFDRRQKIFLMNNTLKRWIDKSDMPPNHTTNLNIEFSHLPEILTFFHDVINQPVRHYEKNIIINHKTNQRKIQLFVEPLPSNSRRKSFWLATFLDCSTDDEIVQAKTWCKMAQKTAHDVKNPLTTIRLTLERLEIFKPELSPSAAEKFDLYVKRIIERVESLRRISKNFMKFVNVDTLNPVNTNLNEFLNEATITIRAGLPPDIQLEFQAGANLPMLKIDQDAMQSVIENLVSNAINAMPEGGRITVITQFLQRLTFPGNGQVARDCVLIEVLDTGIGISESDRDHLFEPDFTRTENGNGLGLAYIKKTIDDHNGYIEVESEPGSGSVFSIYIPTA